jgi:hypothetical protein
MSLLEQSPTWAVEMVILIHDTQSLCILDPMKPDLPREQNAPKPYSEILQNAASPRLSLLYSLSLASLVSPAEQTSVGDTSKGSHVLASTCSKDLFSPSLDKAEEQTRPQAAQDLAKPRLCQAILEPGTYFPTTNNKTTENGAKRSRDGSFQARPIFQNKEKI